MSGIEFRDGTTEAEARDDIDRAVEEALDLEFASFEEVQEAFQH